jgi:putative spermidine/putrescine transport system permease protein
MKPKGAWLIGAPHVRTMPILMITFLNNQLVVQMGAVLVVFLWVPSFLFLLSRAAISAPMALGRGLGG